MLLADILLATERADRARDLLVNVVEQHPLIARPHYLLGLACRDLGLGDEEADAYRAAVALDPDLAIAWYRLGNHLSLKREWREAVAAYREALRIQPDDEAALSGAAFALHRAGKPAGAQECLDRLRALESELVPLLELALEPPKPIPTGVRLRPYGHRKQGGEEAA